ncbi:TniQ family protein [Paracoccus sp. (in: a-proteobacteria)]|uniref:TniQ family protein n=1 Tax=Paracoccus sp. TaxID=267 RepID=UPI00289F8B45|nr:TniQ family protein [Paracoccus sp. (in: a-proteobacteria)]
MSEALTPRLPFNEDELAQGYFIRTGYFHAGVSLGAFCGFTQINRKDVRDGKKVFVDRLAGMSGQRVDVIAQNTLVARPNKTFHLRGEDLGISVIRRTEVRFCPQCLQEDIGYDSAINGGLLRFRWAWLLRPVMTCRQHGVMLAELREPDTVKAFDLPKLIADHEFKLERLTHPPAQAPGPLHTYVEARLWGKKDAVPWLDGQGIEPAVKSCEMLGALIEGGPNALIKAYTAEDWARVGDIGIKICSQGSDTIADVLGQLKIAAGRRSGRTGPQAAYGILFNWLNYMRGAEKFAPLRQVLRDAILDNFAIGHGEVILGEEVRERRVHSVNSFVTATGIKRFRLYRLMRKAGMIPETADEAAFNQWVFGAAEGEQLITRIQNSVPLNKVKEVLGCSKTQAEQLAQQGVIASIVPTAEGAVGLTQGYYNRDDLAEFMAEVFAKASSFDTEEDGYVDLTRAARPLSSTIEILRWQLDGKLPGTRLLRCAKRLDHLRFRQSEVLSLVAVRRGQDLCRFSSVAIALGIPISAVKKLASTDRGGPWLLQAPQEICVGFAGAAYVSMSEVERFQAAYATIAMISRTVGIHFRAVQKMLEERSILPAFDPGWLGTHVYLQADVEGFVVEFEGTNKAEKYAENRRTFGHNSSIFPKNDRFGESDATVL